MRTLLILIVAGITSAHAQNHDVVKAAIQKLIPEATDPVINPSAIDGLLEVTIGPQVLYFSRDGEHMLVGPLYQLDGIQNLTERRLAKMRKTLLSDTGDLNTIDYPSSNPEHQITVVTDIDCPYCRKLHQEMATYNEAGFDVSYIMLPRAGKGSESYYKTISAACDANPALAVTAAMQGERPESKQCDHPIDNHIAMAQALGVTSTPNIVMPDGTLIRGYKTAAELTAVIQSSQQ